MAENKPLTAAEFEKLQAENKALKAAAEQRTADESTIKAKMAAGLTRDQAQAVIVHQANYEKAKAPKK